MEKLNASSNMQVASSDNDNDNDAIIFQIKITNLEIHKFLNYISVVL